MPAAGNSLWDINGTQNKSHIQQYSVKYQRDVLVFVEGILLLSNPSGDLSTNIFAVASWALGRSYASPIVSEGTLKGRSTISLNPTTIKRERLYVDWFVLSISSCLLRMVWSFIIYFVSIYDNIYFHHITSYHTWQIVLKLKLYTLDGTCIDVCESYTVIRN